MAKMTNNLPELAIVAAAYLIAGTLKGALGLGFSTTCLPILVLGLGHRESLPLVIIPSVFSNLLVMRATPALVETAREYWLLYAVVIPGVVLGLWALHVAGTTLPTIILGAVLIAYAGFGLVRPDIRIKAATARRAMVPVGFVNGVVNGLTGSQVMPVVPFLLAAEPDQNRFIQAVNAVFTLSSIVMFFGLSQAGLVTGRALAISVVGIAVVHVGVAAGTRVRALLSDAMFRRSILLVLAALGISLIIQVVFAE